MLRETPFYHGCYVRTQQYYSSHPAAPMQDFTNVSPVAIQGSYKMAETWPELNPGPFKPGVYRENPCRMYEWSSISDDACVWEIEGPLVRDIRQTWRYTGSQAAYHWGSTHLNPYLPYVFKGYPVFETSRQDLAYMKAQAKFQEADTDVALMLAELGETLAMLLNPCKALREFFVNFFLSVGRKRRRTASSFADAVTGSWLEYRYGILPLISDVQALIEAYEGISGIDSNVLLAKRGSSVLRSASVHSVEIPSSYTTGRVEASIKTKDRYHTKISYNSLLLTGMDPSRRLAAWGFAPSQLVSVAWELVPFSFVSDWVWNFGDWLRAVMPNPEVKVLGVSTSHKVEREVKASFSMRLVDPAFKFVGAPPVDSYGSTESFLQRVLHSQYQATPGINAEILNLKRTLDSLSLIWQLLPKSLRR